MRGYLPSYSPKPAAVPVTPKRPLSRRGCAVKDALKMFRDEHRSLAAVLRAMHDLVERVHGGGLPDFDGLRAMLYYVDAYSARLHHPKEDELLFQPLRARGGDADALVEELEREHARLAAAMSSLEQSFLRYETGGESEFVAFATAIEGFCEFYLRHMREEETLVLPLAETLFSDADWARIDAASAAAREPQGGAAEEREFQQLLRRILGPGMVPPSADLPATLP